MKLHLWLTITWATLGALLTYLWMDSVPWVNAMSWYAIVVSHWGAYQATRAERAAEGASVD